MINKVGCAFPMAISSDSRMKQHRDDGHQEDATHFTSFTGFFGAFHGTRRNKILFEGSEGYLR